MRAAGPRLRPDRYRGPGPRGIAEAGAEPTLVQRLGAAGIWNWADGRKRELGATRSRELKGEATTEADGFKAQRLRGRRTRHPSRSATGPTAGRARHELVGGALGLFFDWSQRAEAEAENWAVVRAGEARDATVDNMGVLQRLRRQPGRGGRPGDQRGVPEALGGAAGGDPRLLRLAPRQPRRAGRGGRRARLPAGGRAEGPLIEAMRVRGGRQARQRRPEPRTDRAWPSARASAPSRSRSSSTRRCSAGVTGWGTDEEQIYSNLPG